jgi:ATP-dependent DNA helicase DinG
MMVANKNTSLEDLLASLNVNSPALAKILKGRNTAASEIHASEEDDYSAPNRQSIYHQIEKDYQRLGANISGFKPRKAQQDIMRYCAETVMDGSLTAIEAGTGVGKTFAYILGCLPMVRDDDKRLVISTHTIALQSQLMEKDLPFLKEHLFPELNIALAKGAGRYLCPRRLDSLVNVLSGEKPVSEDLFEDEKVKNSKQFTGHQQSLITTIQEEFNDGAFNGDFDTLAHHDASSVISLINRDAMTCPGESACSKRDNCPFYSQVKRVKEADIVVTNHALLSQAGLKGLSTLSQGNDHLNKSIIVLDEAHKMADVYRDAHTASLDLEEVFMWLKHAKDIDTKTMTMFNKAGIDKLINGTELRPVFERVEKTADACYSAMLALKQFLTKNFVQLMKRDLSNKEQNKAEQSNACWTLSATDTMDSVLTELLITSFDQISFLENALLKLFEEVSSYLKKYSQNVSASKRHHMDVWRNSVKNLGYKFQNIHECLLRYVQFSICEDDRSRAESGFARWITKTGGASANFVIESNTLNIAESFQKRLVETSHAMVLTSATLKALGKFDFFTERLGIDADLPQHRVEEVASSFDYSRVKLSVTPRYMDFKSEKYPLFVHQQVSQICARHKAVLVLFTSNDQMKKVNQLCQKGYLKDQILMQNQLSKSELIRQHKARIDEGKLSVIFGVDSMYEGVDLQGDYLTSVVIAKLPFPNVFTQPLLKYESECVNFLAGDKWSAFNNLSVPMCAMKLVQGVGRLMRTETDTGEVYILDARLHASCKKSWRYRRTLLEGLPMRGAGSQF